MVIIDYLGGLFLSGAAEAGSDAIIDVDLGEGTGDELRIRGTKNADTFVIGVSGIKTNSDADLDIDYTGIESMRVSTGTGNDSISGEGDTDAGGAVLVSLTLFGGAGSDTLEGGPAADVFNGGDDDICLGGETFDDPLTCEL